MSFFQFLAVEHPEVAFVLAILWALSIPALLVLILLELKGASRAVEHVAMDLRFERERRRA